MDSSDPFPVSPLIIRSLVVMEDRQALKLVREMRLHSRQQEARTLLWEMLYGNSEMQVAARKQSKANARKAIGRGRRAVASSIQRLARCRLALDAAQERQQLLS